MDIIIIEDHFIQAHYAMKMGKKCSLLIWPRSSQVDILLHVYNNMVINQATVHVHRASACIVQLVAWV